jgi:phosphatidylserine/phosphatidylglycerophosphate/cardiolipin synthase-like enzyme
MPVIVYPKKNFTCRLCLVVLALLVSLSTGFCDPGNAVMYSSDQSHDAVAPVSTIESENLAQVVGTLEFLESYPEETELDLPEFDEACQVWPVLLGQAEQSIDVASFYFSRSGDGSDSQTPAGLTDCLVTSINALVRAAGNGRQVRVLGDAKFQKTYPEALAMLDETEGVESRVVDLESHWGGVMHAKYFVVDERILYVGSQNWDWRALTQIRELGALITHPELAGNLGSIFELDWSLAGGHALEPVVLEESVPFARLPHALLKTTDGELVEAVLAASPPEGLPDDVPWDLPLLIEMISAATSTVRLQLLSYNVSDRDGNYFAELDNALRAAAARQVKVSILISNWSKVHYKLHWLQSLAAVDNINVKFSNIPEHSRGFIPYARVEHPKYMTVDGQRAWLGTSNWSRDYFYFSRNVSLFFHGAGAAAPLDRFFARGWNSPYSEIVDPSGHYEPPGTE